MIEVASTRLPIVLREPQHEDVAGILAIVRAHGLPDAWAWPEGKHGVVAVKGEKILAFCILSENPWGIVCDELWQEPGTKDGNRALSLLSLKIEEIARDLADRRGVPVMCGGVVRTDKRDHIKALRRRGYSTEAVVLAKSFAPRSTA